MADTKAIQDRIKSVRDTRKITNAMYLISSTKLRKARKKLEETSPFFRRLRQEIGSIIDRKLVLENRYLSADTEDREDNNGVCGILVITADKGLAGAYNQNVLRKAMALMEQRPDYKLFVVGEYGRRFFASHNITFDEDFQYVDEEPTLYEARMIAGYIMDLFDRHMLSEVHIIYTDFKNALSSEAIDLRMLPFDRELFIGYSRAQEEEFEYFPSPEAVLEHCIPVYAIGMIYSVLVYSFCCEQNDRMMAMDAANQNADELIQSLSLQYNHLRQNSITQEITEISASVKAKNR